MIQREKLKLHSHGKFFQFSLLYKFKTMASLGLFLLLLLTFGIYVASHSPADISGLSFEIYCIQKPNGLYQSGHFSKLYFACENNKITPFLCSEGYVFDEIIAKCVIQPKMDAYTELHIKRFNEILETLRFCDGKKDGFYTFDSKCTTSYIRCFNSEPNFYICPQIENKQGVSEVTYWHPYVGKCAWKSDVPSCEEKNMVRLSDQLELLAKPLCDGEIGLTGVGYCKNTLLKCDKSGRIKIRSCPIGLVFSDVKHNCTLPDLCSIMHQQQLNADCEKLGTGIYRAPGCSRDFLECKNGKGYIGYCPEGQSYDTSLQSCRNMNEGKNE